MNYLLIVLLVLVCIISVLAKPKGFDSVPLEGEEFPDDDLDSIDVAESQKSKKKVSPTSSIPRDSKKIKIENAHLPNGSFTQTKIVNETDKHGNVKQIHTTFTNSTKEKVMARSQTFSTHLGVMMHGYGKTHFKQGEKMSCLFPYIDANQKSRASCTQLEGKGDTKFCKVGIEDINKLIKPVWINCSTEEVVIKYSATDDFINQREAVSITTDGSRCRFPFIFNGQSYSHCSVTDTMRRNHKGDFTYRLRCGTQQLPFGFNPRMENCAVPADDESFALMNYDLVELELMRKQRSYIESDMLHKSIAHSSQYVSDIYRSLQLSRSICGYINQEELKTSHPTIRKFITKFTKYVNQLYTCFADKNCDYDLHANMQIMNKFNYSNKKQKNRLVAFWQETLELNKQSWNLQEKARHIRIQNDHLNAAINSSSGLAISMFDELEFIMSQMARISLTKDYCGHRPSKFDGYSTPAEWIHVWYKYNLNYVKEERLHWATNTERRTISDVQIIWKRSDLLRQKVCDTLDFDSIYSSKYAKSLLNKELKNAIEIVIEYDNNIDTQINIIKDTLTETLQLVNNVYIYRSDTNNTARKYAINMIVTFAKEYHRLHSEIALFKHDYEVVYKGMRELANKARQQIRILYDRRISHLSAELTNFVKICRHNQIPNDHFNGPSIPNPKYNGTLNNGNTSIVDRGGDDTLTTNETHTESQDITTVPIDHMSTDNHVTTLHTSSPVSTPEGDYTWYTTTEKDTNGLQTGKDNSPSSLPPLAETTTSFIEHSGTSQGISVESSESGYGSDDLITTPRGSDITTQETEHSGTLPSEIKTTKSRSSTEHSRTLPSEIKTTKSRSSTEHSGTLPSEIKTTKSRSSTEQSGSWQNEIKTTKSRSSTSGISHGSGSTYATISESTSEETSASGSLPESPVDRTDTETTSGALPDITSIHLTKEPHSSTKSTKSSMPTTERITGILGNNNKKITTRPTTAIRSPTTTLTEVDETEGSQNSGSGESITPDTTPIYGSGVGSSTKATTVRPTTASQTSTITASTTTTATTTTTTTPEESTQAPTTEHPNNKCLFPFVYRRRMYMDCVDVGGAKKCASKNYHNGSYEMTDCKPTISEPKIKGKTLGITTKGENCKFPFEYKNKTYSKCSIISYNMGSGVDYKCKTRRNKLENCAKPGDDKSEEMMNWWITMVETEVTKIVTYEQRVIQYSKVYKKEEVIKIISSMANIAKKIPSILKRIPTCKTVHRVQT